LSLRLVAPHKDALGCVGKHRPRRRWAISINGQRFRSGRRLGGCGHRNATGATEGCNPRCEISEIRNTLGFAYHAMLDSEGAPPPLRFFGRFETGERVLQASLQEPPLLLGRHHPRTSPKRSSEKFVPRRSGCLAYIWPLASLLECCSRVPYDARCKELAPASGC
jgi:hypothetical protein